MITSMREQLACKGPIFTRDVCEVKILVWYQACGCCFGMSESNGGILRSKVDLSVSTKKGIVWDESNLLQNEQEKVPRMKVDEPKTPFHYMDGSTKAKPTAVLPDNASDEQHHLDIYQSQTMSLMIQWKQKF
jgi:hypothetical protein